MPASLIRVLAVVFSLVLTAGYLFSLYLLTFAGCFMRDASCPQGWLFRTIGTVVYLALVAAIIFLARLSLKKVAQRAAARGNVSADLY